jgi:hypothetical protein
MKNFFFKNLEWVTLLFMSKIKYSKFENIKYVNACVSIKKLILPYKEVKLTLSMLFF